MRFLFLLGLLTLPLQAYDPPTTKPQHPLTYPDDTFAFKNETVWNYVNGQPAPETPGAKREHQYDERCFVLSRSIVQFWKFARFDPSQKPLDATALAHRIREITERSVWLPALAEQDRIVIPGYHNLREASAAMTATFQANLGLGWPFYFRFGNGVIAMWVSRHMEAALNAEVWHDLQMNTPTILWIYRFPSLKLNHVIVVLSGTHDAHGYHYHIYDPNYADRYSLLDYDPATRTFALEPRYYFPGGPVTARSIYRQFLQ